MAKFKKGQSGNPNGRPKGTKNKLTNDVVKEILEIHQKLIGKKKGLFECADQNPKWFYEVFFKNLIPKNIDFNLGADNSLTVFFEKIAGNKTTNK